MKAGEPEEEQWEEEQWKEKQWGGAAGRRNNRRSRNSERRRSNGRRSSGEEEQEGGEAVGKSKCSLPLDVLLQHGTTENLITWIPAHHLRHK